MKKVTLYFMIVSILMVFSTVYADELGSWDSYNYCPYCGSYMGQGGGMGPGMMGQGMMGDQGWGQV